MEKRLIRINRIIYLIRNINKEIIINKEIRIIGFSFGEGGKNENEIINVCVYTQSDNKDNNIETYFMTRYSNRRYIINILNKKYNGLFCCKNVYY